MKKLATNCLFVKGYKKNLIIDLQNNCWYHVDENEDEILSETLDKIRKDYLLRNGIILDLPDHLIDSFPKLDLLYLSPQITESIIIDLNDDSPFTIPFILSKLDYLNPVFLQIRFFNVPNFETLKESIDCLQFFSIESAEIIMPFNIEIFDNLILDNYLLKSSKIFRVYFHSCTSDLDLKGEKIYFTTEQIIDESFCGRISAFDFSNNFKHVLKSINFNSCLYKKIGIDVKGNIKNCPSTKHIFVNIKDVNVNSNLLEFKFETAKIKKDNIEVCQDCEFRYVCTDCRAYTDSNSRPNARPLKCEYNPYISKWKHEGDYVSFDECGVISNETTFTIDHLKIASINAKK